MQHIHPPTTLITKNVTCNLPLPLPPPLINIHVNVCVLFIF